MDFKNYIKSVEGFPKEGISFKDITPLLRDQEAFKNACKELASFAKEVGATVIVGPESRGFIFGCPIAYELNVGFVPVRKPGKLPRETVQVEYSLEYGLEYGLTIDFLFRLCYNLIISVVWAPKGTKLLLLL